MILYLDTSSLLKLYVEEPGTSEVQSRVELADVVATSVIAYPEAHAAVARRYREGALTKGEFEAVLDRFRETWARFFTVLLGAPVHVRAGTLAVKYVLRGMDAIHLASYAEILDRGDAEFLSHDDRLMEAAAKHRRQRRRRS